MKPLISGFTGFLLVFFAVEVNSSHYRGGTISYRPNASSPYSVDFSFRVSLRRSSANCDQSIITNRNFLSYGNYWYLTRYGSYYTYSYSGNARVYCSSFNAEEDWSEGYNNFTFTGGHDDVWWSVKVTDGGNWISGITHSNPYNNILLNARVNNTGVFNNSSPVSSLPLTVYVHKSAPSVIRIPVDDPDGDIVRCRNASYQECYRGMCTYFPYGVLDEASCTLSYNGGGSTGQLFPIILMLEDFPRGTTQFDSSNSLGSVDLQFIVNIVNISECQNYTVLDTRDRSQGVPRGNVLKCDQYDLNKGWYRFSGEAGSAMPTSCVPKNRCGTHAPGWMVGSHPTRAQGIVSRNVCYHWGGSCCLWSNMIRVRNCGGFYVYEFIVPPNCWLRYCGNGGNNTCASSLCRNGGTCVITNNGYKCNCPHGYTGQQCETNFCASSPCRNNGTCVTTYNGYRCNCQTGNTGLHCETNICARSPCLNGGACRGNRYWPYCTCPYGYTGRQCETNTCVTSPCRNGGTCVTTYNGHRCNCPHGYSGQQCETNLKVRVTCGEKFLQIELKEQYFPDLDWHNVHLKSKSCKATKTFYATTLRAPLDGCGTTYIEHDKKIAFWNEVRYQQALWSGVGNFSAITRTENLVIPFYCEYAREKLISTSFSPSKKTIYASEGSYGNFTFTMDLYRNSSYSTPYSIFAYPVVVSPNQPLWVQYEVKNTNADLVVFAENCRATTSSNPNSYPQHVILERGCVRDPTMVYWYNPYSRVQRFSIRSFRFVYSNTFLVYLHCELIVCHRNSTNSRCARGCISSRGRRETADMDGSNSYDLSVGPLKGSNNIGTDKQDEEGPKNGAVVIAVSSVVAVVVLAAAILIAVKILHGRHIIAAPKSVTTPPAVAMEETVNSYEQHVFENDEKMEIEI